MIDFGLGVQLGCLSDLDADMIRRWRNDYRVWKYCRQNDLIEKTTHYRWYTNECTDETNNQMYSVIAKDGKLAVGVCGLTGIDLVNLRAEFSLYIAPDYQSMGYGSNALRTLVSHGFSSYPLQSIWGESFDFNPALSMFMRVGFSEDGRRRNFYFRDGKFVDAVIVSVLKSEWVGGRLQLCST